MAEKRPKQPFLWKKKYVRLAFNNEKFFNHGAKKQGCELLSWVRRNFSHFLGELNAALWPLCHRFSSS